MDIDLISSGEDFDENILSLINNINKLLVDVSAFESTFDVVIHKADLLVGLFPDKRIEVSCIIEELYFITVNLFQTKITHERKNNDKFFFNRDKFDPTAVAKRTFEVLAAKGDIKVLLITVGAEAVNLLIKYITYLVNKAKIQEAEQLLYSQMADVFYKILISSFYEYGTHSLLINNIRTNLYNVTYSSYHRKGLKTVLAIINVINEYDKNITIKNNSFYNFKNEFLEETANIVIKSSYNFEENSIQLLSYLRQNNLNLYEMTKRKALEELKLRVKQNAKNEILRYRNGSLENKKLIMLFGFIVFGLLFFVFYLLGSFILFVTNNSDKFQANNKQGDMIGLFIICLLIVSLLFYLYGPILYIRYRCYKEIRIFGKKLEKYTNIS